MVLGVLLSLHPTATYRVQGERASLAWTVKCITAGAEATHLLTKPGMWVDTQSSLSVLPCLILSPLVINSFYCFPPFAVWHVLYTENYNYSLLFYFAAASRTNDIFFKLANHLQYICHFIMNIHHLNWLRNTKPSGNGRGITLQVNGKTWVMQTIITVIYFSLLKNTWHQDCIIEINQLQSKTHFQIFVCFWFITQHPNNIISICFIVLVL